MDIIATEKPKVSIGMPVYNGEKFIQKRLDNILSQTFKDFELIISDDSTDSTPLICEEYVKKDKRVRYIHQQKRMGWVRGFISVLKEAKMEYFVWAAVDDIWTPDFLEKNVRVLDSNSKIQASFGKIKTFGSSTYDVFKFQSNDSILLRFYKYVRQKFRPPFMQPIMASGSYEVKAKDILRNTNYHHLYALHRTEALHSSIIENELFVWDWATVLNSLKYGDFHVIDETLYHVFTGDTTTRRGIIKQLGVQNTRWNEYLMPYSTFTYWCAKNIGIRFFFQNIGYFTWLNFCGEVAIIHGLFLFLRSKIIRNKN